MNDKLYYIIDIIWAFDFISLAVFAYIAKMQSKVNSSLISLVVVMAFAGLMLGYQAFLQHHDGPEPSRLIQFFWYTGFAIFYLLLIMVIRWTHILLRTPLQVIAKFYSVVAALLAVISLLQYTEILYFGSDDLFDSIYTFGVPFVNFMSSAIVMGMGLYALFKLRKSVDALRELKWSI